MINKISIVFLTTLLIITTKISIASDVDITNYGAAGDGKTLNSSAIQSAIDDCSKTGGGKVYFPAGNWLCGTILLKNNVVLSLNEKAVLLGSTNIADYFIVDGFTDGTGQVMGYCFVGAVDVKNVGIEGKGIINGQGKLVYASGGKTKRPFLIRFVRCENVNVKGLHLQSSTAWTMHIFHCRKVAVDGVTIFSRGLANNDGIDIDCCEDVAIKNCDITSDDDGICFKTTSPYPCKNILVSNIKIRTNCSAIKMGTESTGDFQNIKISHINISYAGLGAIKLLSVDGSHLGNIEISDVDADTANVAMLFRLGARLKTFRPQDVKKDVGTLSNIKIKNVKVKHATLAGIIFSGLPDHNIADISLENIAINLTGGGTEENAKLKLAENPDKYPESTMFGKIIPAYAMYIRHANNLNIKNIIITTDKPDARPALIAEDAATIFLEKWKLPVASSPAPVINFASVNSAVIKKFELSQKPSIFLSVESKSSNEIMIEKVKFVTDKSSINLAADVNADAVKIKLELQKQKN